MPDAAAVEKLTDDRLTLISIAACGCVLGDILHEAVGHGVVAYFSGARTLTLSTVALSSDISTRPIDAAGTLVNLAAGILFWLLLRRAVQYKPATRYFLILCMAANLFSATGYFFFSGVTNFGDWAAVISGLHPHWLWRLGMVAVGVPSYYAVTLLVAAQFKPFQSGAARLSRLRPLCWTPYFTDGILAGVAGLLNPAGLFYVIASALPATLGAQTGLFVLPFMMRAPHFAPSPSGAPVPAVPPIGRNRAWIVAGAVAALLFILVLGRGLTWRR